MPSTMVHLITAYKYKPDSPEEFWVGNIAPDCIADWKERDNFHFRNEPNIEQALHHFARGIHKNDWFSEGMLLHLFVDWKWDLDLRQRFIRNHGSDDWFHRKWQEPTPIYSAEGTRKQDKRHSKRPPTGENVYLKV